MKLIYAIIMASATKPFFHVLFSFGDINPAAPGPNYKGYELVDYLTAEEVGQLMGGN